MGVRNTESRIPGGFDKASELGYAKYHSPDNNYVLISHLPKDLKVDLLKLEKKQLFNRYHLFVDTINVDDNIIYSWKISFFRADQEDPFFETESKQTEYGYFILTSSPPELTGHENKDYTFSFFEHPDLFVETITKIIIHVSVLEPGADLELESNINLSLEHNITHLNNDIESLMGSTDKPFAKGGDPETTRRIANDYKEYLTDRTWGLYSDKIEGSDVPLNLVASTLYLNLIQIPEDALLRYDTLWENYINDNIETSELYNLPIGIGQIIPNFVAMFIPPPDNTTDNTTDNTICPLCYVEESDNYDTFLSLTFRNFASLSGDNEKYKIDIINLARFPKSAIKLMELYLSNLIENSRDNERLCNNELIENRPCLTSIITEYFFGPYINEFKVEKSSNKYFNFMFFPFIQEIIKKSKISYELLKIKILDIRSGQPVKNTLIKQIVIVINPGANERKYGYDTIDFMNDVKPGIREKNIIDANDTVIERAQKSLNLLGYHHGNPDVKFGPAGRGQYNKYWQDRSIDVANPIYSIAEGNPKEIPLKEIIKEYKMCGATDKDGCLNIRIPTAFLNNKKMHIEIGFWDFPIVCEALLNEPNMISRLTDAETATEFRISWIGNDAANKQKLNWEKNIKHEAHFGWKVKKGTITSQLRVAEKLIVKNNLEEFTGFKNNLLSKFFNQYHNPTHFVLFGMQWCQPVWDRIDDSDNISEGAINYSSYRQKNDILYNMMHITTMSSDLGGYWKYGGKGYGKYEWVANTKYRGKKAGAAFGDHNGIDIHAVMGDNVFAAHGGEVSYLLNNGNNGNKITINWPNVQNQITACIYAHMHDIDPEVVAINNNIIMAGMIIGRAGRTGNLYVKSNQPGHFHFWGGVQEGDIFPLSKTPDTDNLVCIPSNNTPLLLPCACQVTNFLTLTTAEILRKINEEGVNGKNEIENDAKIPCSFRASDIQYVQFCWAVAELTCPYMNSFERNSTMRIQAQLRYLNEKSNNTMNPFIKDSNAEYLYPGNVDGDDEGIVSGGDINLNAGDKIEADSGEISFEDGNYRRVKSGSVVGWVLRSELGTWSSVSNEYTLNSDLAKLLHGGKKKKEFSNTRMAIYRFRERTKKANNSNFLKPGNENNWENYTIKADEDVLLNKLNEKAEITPPT